MISKKEKNGISVVIPNYNGTTLLVEVLDSLYESLIASTLAYEIIICDDCSTDNSVELIKNNYPEIKIDSK